MSPCFGRESVRVPVVKQLQEAAIAVLLADRLNSPADCWTESKFPSLLPPHWDKPLRSWLWAGQWPHALTSAAPSPPTHGGRRKQVRSHTTEPVWSPTPAGRRKAHQNSLVQHLTALHVGRLYVDAVSPALPEGTNHIYCCGRHGTGSGFHGTGSALHRKIHLHLHVSETLDAKKRLILRGEQDVGFLVEGCGDRQVGSPGVHSGETQVRFKVWREDSEK